MEAKQNTNLKTTVFNLIILDESGSMSHLKQSTISGCNEVLNVVRRDQEQAGDSRTNLVSIFAFQSGGGMPSRYLAKNEPSTFIKDLTPDDYQPCGCTPLYDAVGSTLTDLKAYADKCEDASAIVTIITDGYENSSTHYTGAKVAKMIASLKELGWTFNFIGANIDVDKISQALNIDNAMEFKATAAGVKKMMYDLSSCLSKAQSCYDEDRYMTREQRVQMRKKRSSSFFKK